MMKNGNEKIFIFLKLLQFSDFKTNVSVEKIGMKFDN